VIDIASVTNPDTLRQLALLQDRQIHRLLGEVASLRAQVAELKGEAPGDAQQELAYLKELLAQREQELFGRSSERRSGQGSGNAGSPPKQEKPQRGHGPTQQPRLPVVEQVYELPESERQCPACGGDCLEELADETEDAEEVTVVEQKFTIRVNRRKKYRCQCNGAVVTAPMPARLIPGGRYSTEFAVHVAVGKYLDHMPLERQVRAMGRQGLEVTSQTLWDQVNALATHLEPSYHALLARVLEAPVVFADETRWPMLDGGHSPFWAWGLSTADTAYYRITKGRSTEEAEQLLGRYRGTLMADGYDVYAALARAAPFTLASCWAHVRRKLVEAEGYAPDEAGFAIERIGQLYKIEREIAAAAAQVSQEERLSLRVRLRQERLSPLLDELRKWAFETLPTVLPRSGIGKATKYMLSRWQGLTVLLEDPRVPLDNNHAERSLRGMVLGRKNHYGSRSLRGCRVAAIMYSLMESAKLSGVNPSDYILQAVLAAIRTPGTVTLPAHLAG
jgi:transposase